MSSLLDAALRYADLDYSVLPCASGTKDPITEHGFKDATTNLDKIAEWWHFNPSANIGVATEDLVVIDIDGRDNRWLSDQPERAVELAQAPLCTTPRGGRHYYFKQTPGCEVRCSTGKLAKGVDVRASGGYAVLPPSMRGSQAYTWVPGLELDCPPDKLPEVPAWLAEDLARIATQTPTAGDRASSAGQANPIPTGQRNATLARQAGAMRRIGMSEAEIAAALLQANEDRCQPPLPVAEVERIAASVGRYTPDSIATAFTEDHWSQMQAGPGERPEPQFVAITSRELATGKFELEYLIDGLLVRGQPGVLAGPKKTLKTNISIDLAISLSQGGFFLHRFPVAKPTRVGVMSGESGAATIQETAKRIAVSKGFALEDCENAVWCFDVPQLNNKLQMQALRALIEQHRLDVLVLDPTYLMMLGLGDDAGNLFIVGGFLKSLGELAQATGCTPILCHHLKMSIADPYEPAELENIAWAGFQEFVRQWLLLNRRVRYDPDRSGHHELWMSAGGSAGHSGLWGLNIDEGTRQDRGGRHWDVTVLSASEAYSDRDEAQEMASEAKRERQLERRSGKQREAVLRVLQRFPDGETPRGIREAAGIGAKAVQTLLNDLVEEGLVAPCTVVKNKREEPAYRFV